MYLKADDAAVVIMQEFSNNDSTILDFIFKFNKNNVFVFAIC